MNLFLRRFIQNKKYILIVLIITFLLGFIYGFFIYSKSNEIVKDFLCHLFYLNNDQYTNQYQLYLIQCILLIFISTYLSTSYLGCVGLLFLGFIKGIHISFSLSYVISVIDLNFIVILMIILEIIIELLLSVVILFMNTYLSLFITLITFFLDKTMHIKNTVNYRLNTTIVSLLLLSVSLCLRLYLIPMF